MQKYSIIGIGLLMSAFLTGCGVPLSEQVSVGIETSDESVVLEKANNYRETVDLKWTIQNDSDQPLTGDTYELNLLSLYGGSNAATLLETVELNVEPHGRQAGLYPYLIDGIGSEGDYQFQIVLYEKDGVYLKEVKTASIPYTLNWGK